VNLFRHESGSMSAEDTAIAQALADIATIAIVQHQTAIEARVVNEQLTVALNSRIIIEQAKGVIAERNQLNVVQAFDLLRSHARRGNRRLAEMATEIVNGTLRL
jgi:AmiR/NasT family two-component response regulator